MPLIPVQPIGTQTAGAFVDGERNGHRFGEFQIREIPKYPPSPKGEQLRSLRLQIPYSLRQAANLLGIGVVQLSGLERGTHTYTKSEEWDRAFDALRRFILPKP